MRTFQTACATIALLALSNPALAACATPDDASALKTAVMQQELMVAAFQCHEAGAYNRFVMAYRGELQASDAALKAYFVRRDHSEAGYDAFKTKAANLSALEQARDARAFCADAHALFAAAAHNQSTLAGFVESRSADSGTVCTAPRPVVAVAAKPAPVLVQVADVRPADTALGGVPQHSLPANPWRHDNIEAPPRTDMRDAAAEDSDARPAYAPSYANDDDAPPPRPRAYPIRDRDYGEQRSPERSYGPPPNWRDPYQQGWRERPRWYERDDYYR